jgi:hypothetical protein
MKNWKISTHLCCFHGLLLSLLCVGSLGLYSLRGLCQRLQTVYLDRSTAARPLDRRPLRRVIVDATHKTCSGELSKLSRTTTDYSSANKAPGRAYPATQPDRSMKSA